MLQLTNAMVIPNNTRKIQSSPNLEMRNFCTRATQSGKILQFISDYKSQTYFTYPFARLIIIDLCTWNTSAVSWTRRCGPAPPPVCHECSLSPGDGGCDGDFGCDSAHGDCDGGAHGGDVHGSDVHGGDIHAFFAVSPSEGEWLLSAGTHQGALCTLHIADNRRNNRFFWWTIPLDKTKITRNKINVKCNKVKHFFFIFHFHSFKLTY